MSKLDFIDYDASYKKPKRLISFEEERLLDILKDAEIDSQHADALIAELKEKQRLTEINEAKFKLYELEGAMNDS